ncbi:hypothetical protein Daus18300_014133 [Diaporthe australafricana]|uniref:2EXR domain-containing protein n=1 Tax=Diaporthe australafricana TaxID=127596 RepID=A0ABR3VWD2_9PEZI
MAGETNSTSQSSGHTDNPSLQVTHRADSSPELSRVADFHLFAELPPELRQMIFAACLPRRIFMFSYSGSLTGSMAGVGKKPRGLPWIGMVCKEAYHISKMFVREYRMDLTTLSWLPTPAHYGTTTIQFNLKFDSLMLNYFGSDLDDNEDGAKAQHDRYLESLPNGPYALAALSKIPAVLNIHHLVGPRLFPVAWHMPRSYRAHLIRRDHCDVVLAGTQISLSDRDIRTSGLFGLFGEERHVLVDIADTAKIDRYEKYIRQSENEGRGVQNYGWSFYPQPELRPEPWGRRGCRRYGTRGRLIDWRKTHPDGVKVPPADFTVAAKDAAAALKVIKMSWLEANHCFEPEKWPAVPWTGDSLDRDWDDEHPVAKSHLSKLPRFSFLAMYTVKAAK